MRGTPSPMMQLKRSPSPQLERSPHTETREEPTQTLHEERRLCILPLERSSLIYDVYRGGFKYY